MYRALVRRALIAPRAAPIARTICSTPRLCSEHKAPSLFGSGSPTGAVPTDEAQATGMDRLQMLGKMEGVDVFNQKAFKMTRLGTMADPISVHSLGPERIVGCTGYPVDSHDVIWMPLRAGKKGRCPECGSVYVLDYEGGGHDEHNHH